MSKPKMIGTINACATATLFKGTKVVGYCMGTPNAVAYGMAKTGADRAKDGLMGDYLRSEMTDRVENSGWMVSDERAGFVSKEEADAEIHSLDS